MFRATLKSIEDTSGHIKTFWLKPERRVRYEAGQYLDVYLPHDGQDDRGPTRTMSLSSSPTEKLLAITTTFAERGGSTFKQALRSLEPGERVTMHEPMGDFVLPKDTSIPLVFIAGGIGITPVRSMIKLLADKGEQRDVQLIYMARSPASMLYLPLLSSYPGIKLTSIYTQKAPGKKTARKRPSAKKLLKLIGDSQEKLLFLSGPEPLMESYWLQLQDQGIPRKQLVLDYFTGYTQL